MQTLSETGSWMNTEFKINLAEIQSAAVRIEPFVLKTPSLCSERLSKLFDCRLHFKAENLQHIGAFKARGATNAVMQLDDQTATQGVVTHSSGNHAAALARAAALRGIPAYVVMPSNSAQNKINAVRSYGVEPVFCEASALSRAETAERLRSQTGATLVHPYDYPPVMAGQGTVGIEILEQLPNVEAIIVPVGGGGLLSGVLIAVKTLRPEITVYAAEPQWADDAARSLQSGKVELPKRYDTVADGLRTPLGENTFPIIRELVDGIILVSEESILAATRMLSETVHLVAEPSGAVSLAAMMTSAQRFSGKSVAAIISGGNLDFGDCRLGTRQSQL